MVPGAEASGFVAPRRVRPWKAVSKQIQSVHDIHTCFTTSLPCQTMATTGPDDMYLIMPGKKGLPLRSL